MRIEFRDPPKHMRLLSLEQEFTETACRGICNPTGLLTHAQTRSRALCGEYVADPMEILSGLNRPQEAREELADCLNHMLFDMQTHLGDEERLAILMRVTQYVALAYHELGKIE
jgi:hypothetical protein